jgi:hypothetical protein
MLVGVLIGHLLLAAGGGATVPLDTSTYEEAP